MGTLSNFAEPRPVIVPDGEPPVAKCCARVVPPVDCVWPEPDVEPVSPIGIDGAINTDSGQDREVSLGGEAIGALVA